MLKSFPLALCIGMLASSAVAQDYYQRTRLLVQLPARPSKADFTNHHDYRDAMQWYHDETRRILREERRVYRRMYYWRDAPVIIHQIRGGRY